MVAKSSESAIRELTKTVLVLQEKIISLEKLVIDQNTHIKNLLDTRKDSSNNKSDANVGKPRIVMQRPVREARVRALSAINDTSRIVKAGSKISPLTPTTDQATAARHLSASSSRTLAPTQSTPTSPKLEAETNSVGDDVGVNDNGTAWIEVKARRSRRSIVNATHGTAMPGATLLKAAERKSYLHLYYLKLGTTTEEVSEHLRTICSDDVCIVEELKARGNYASFKLSVLTKNVDKYLSAEHWPEDVCIKPWYSRFRKTLPNAQ